MVVYRQIKYQKGHIKQHAEDPEFILGIMLDQVRVGSTLSEQFPPSLHRTSRRSDEIAT